MLSSSDRLVITAEVCGRASSRVNVAPPLKSTSTKLSDSGACVIANPSTSVRSSSDLPDPVAPTTRPCGPIPPRAAWRTRQTRDRLRVAIGVGATGQTVDLDLKEAARGGMGPHGLVVGATGSGKSELLRTLVLGLAMTHAPESLNFVLVDFKGGATFTRLDALPHTSAVITN